jgi:hypothetical protein
MACKSCPRNYSGCKGCEVLGSKAVVSKPKAPRERALQHQGTLVVRFDAGFSREYRCNKWEVPETVDYWEKNYSGKIEYEYTPDIDTKSVLDKILGKGEPCKAEQSVLSRILA